MKTHLRVVSNTEMRTFQRCQREHHYAYTLGYRAREQADALRFGTMIHKGLEAIWLGKPLDVVLVEATENAADAYEAAKARALLRGYDARWPRQQAVAVEREFRAPLKNPETGATSRTFELGGKIDVVLASSFVEHKTTSEEIGPGSTYWQRLTLDSQISAYYQGAKSLGHDVDECLYDVIRKPATRPAQIPVTDQDGAKIVLDADGQRVRTKNGKKWRETADASLGYVLQVRAETPEEYEARLVEEIAANPERYYQRGSVVRLEADERDAAQDAWQITRAMREAEISGRHPRNPDACLRYGRSCGYLDVCTSTASLDDETRFVRVQRVHQELSAEAAE